MRKIPVVGLLLAFLLLIPTAGLWADDILTLSGAWSGATGSQPFAALPFTLSFASAASPTPFASDASQFEILVTGPYTNNGTTTHFSSGSGDSAIFDVTGGFSFNTFGFLTPSDQFIINMVGPPNPVLFSGPTLTPTFIPGTYSLTGTGRYFPPASPQVVETLSATLTIPEPVPEPCSLLLLGTGLVGVVGAARRKWLG